MTKMTTRIDTHGLKMTGLRKVAGDTQSYHLDGEYHNGTYFQINYDMDEGQVWTDYHVSIGQNSWSAYCDTAVILCGNATGPMTQQEIADLIKIKVDERKAMQDLHASILASLD